MPVELIEGLATMQIPTPPPAPTNYSAAPEVVPTAAPEQAATAAAARINSGAQRAANADLFAAQQQQAQNPNAQNMSLLTNFAQMANLAGAALASRLKKLSYTKDDDEIEELEDEDSGQKPLIFAPKNLFGADEDSQNNESNGSNIAGFIYRMANQVTSFFSRK